MTTLSIKVHINNRDVNVSAVAWQLLIEAVANLIVYIVLALVARIAGKIVWLLLYGAMWIIGTVLELVWRLLCWAIIDRITGG